MSCWEKALEFFCSTAKHHGINFYLIGSVTASTRGVDISPHDIDIIVDVDDFNKTKTVFEEYILEPFVENKASETVDFFGRIFIEGFAIDISAKPKNKFGCYTIEAICWNGHIIQMQTLDLLYKVYQKNKRVDYVEAIDNYWANLTV